MTSKVTDEMLMAYVDGELDSSAAEGVRLATERDAMLAKRADDFRMTRQWAKDAFAEIKSEPAAEELIARISGSAAPRRSPLRNRSLFRAALPLAASLALVAGMGGYWFGQQNRVGDAPVFGGRDLAQALGTTSSGQTRSVSTIEGSGQLQVIATYKVEDGYCRSFALKRAEAGRDVLGVGCTRGGDWRVEIAVAAPPAGAYSPASAGGTASIDAFLDAAGARDALSAEEEAALQSKR